MHLRRAWLASALLLWGSVAQAGSELQRVAVLPIVVHARDHQDYLRDGLADMLASRLGRQPGVAVLRVQDPKQATTDAGDAAAAASVANADWVVFGSFTHFGEGASLDIRCVAVGRPDAPDVRSIFVQSGTLGDIIPRLDTLAKQIGLYVSGRSAAGAEQPGAAKATPPPAQIQADMDELRIRVEALENTVYASPGSSSKSEGAAAAAPETPEARGGSKQTDQLAASAQQP